MARDRGWDGYRAGCRLERPSLHVEVGLDIHVQGLQVRVPQDVLDGHGMNTRLEQVHGFGVAEGVRADVETGERRVADVCEPSVVPRRKAAPDRVNGCPRALRRSGAVSETGRRVSSR